MIVNSKKLHFESNLFSACASDIGLRPGQNPIGLIVESEKTKKKVEFFVSKISRKNDGEIRYWRLTPTAVSVSKIPKAAVVRMIIFND